MFLEVITLFTVVISWFLIEKQRCDWLKIQSNRCTTTPLETRNLWPLLTLVVQRYLYVLRIENETQKLWPLQTRRITEVVVNSNLTSQECITSYGTEQVAKNPWPNFANPFFAKKICKRTCCTSFTLFDRMQQRFRHFCSFQISSWVNPTKLFYFVKRIFLLFCNSARSFQSKCIIFFC